jgi:predicted adenine nucleotide alpha hydrolase (AANH) superfamily ATPase
VIEHLSPYFDIAALFYNPNIRPRGEYDRREAELRKLLERARYPNAVYTAACEYEGDSFETVAAGLWGEPEGGRRCRECFGLRLGEAARRAKAGGFDYFATTLSVSPHKDAAALNDIGADLEARYGIRYLRSDFKKRGGYSRSIELSKQFGLYRQSYCGCMDYKEG